MGDDWRVPIGWRSAMHWQWLSPSVCLPQPQLAKSERPDDSFFFDYFDNLDTDNYLRELLFSAYLSCLEESVSVLRGLLEQARLMQGKIFGALATGILFFGQMF